MKKSDIDRILGRSSANVRKEEKQSESKRDNNINAGGRIGLTVLDALGNIGKGAVKTLEGIYDEGATLVGAIGGIFDSDFKDDVAEHIKYDVTDKVFDSMGFDYVEDNSYLEGNKVGDFVRGTASGIGGMLPSVALGFIPGAGAVLAPVSMGVGAAGQATESALNKGAGYYGSAIYGAGMGAVEGVTEAIGGYMLGGGKSLVGKALAGTKLGKFTSKGIGQVAETFISEGFEESLTDLIDPALQYATGVDKNIGENYKEAIKGLPQTFLIGGTVGSIMQGGNVTMNALHNRNRGGFKATRADELFNYIKEVSKNYGKDTSKNTKYDKAIGDALHDVSRELTSMRPEARKNYMEGMRAFKNAFNEDGSIKMDLRADANEGAVSNNLRSISAVLKHKPISSSTEINESAGKMKSYVEKMLGDSARVVITANPQSSNFASGNPGASDKAQNNAFYNPDEGIIYINNNAEFTGEEIAEFVATHEVAHITEGTKEYIKLNQMLEEIAKDPNAPIALKAKIGNVAQRQIEIGELYQEQMEGMTDEQKAYLIRTELNADLVGILLGDEYFIEKLAQRDASLVQKIFNRLKALVHKSSDSRGRLSLQDGNKKSASVDRDSAKYLNKLVNKFGKAIDKSQGGVKISQLGREDEEKNGKNSAENVDFVDEKRYNKVDRKSMDNKADFTSTDYETLRSEVMRKNSSGKGIYPMDYAYTANHIVIYNNHGEADFSIIAIYDIDSYKKKNIAVKEKIDEIDRSSRSVRSDIGRFRDIARRNSRFTNNVEHSGTNGEIGGLYRGDRNTEIQSALGESNSNNKRVKKTRLKEIRFDDDGNVIDEVRYSKSKSSKDNIVFEQAENGGVRVLMPNPELDKMQQKSDAEQVRKENFKALLDETGTLEIETRYENDNATEEEANEQARRNLDYWVNNGDFTQGSVRYVQNGKVKVKLVQTANEAQLVKYINNHMMDKKYSNKDVKNIIDDILVDSNIWGYDEYSSYKGKLKGESLNEVKKLLWAALNTAPEGERISPALDIADYIVKHGILVEMVEVTEDVLRAHEILEALKPYKHNIDVSHIKGDIKVKYDDDNTPYMTWALKKDAKGRGYTADQVGLALEEIGIEVAGDRGKLINEADIFIAIHELYKQAHKTIKEATPHDRAVINAFSGEAAYELKQKIASEILASFDKYGQETTLTKVEKKYKKEIEGLKKQVKDVHEINKLKNAVLYEAQKIKDSKAGKYHNATQVQEQALNALKSLLGRIKYRSDINRSSTREIMKELAKWYTEDNPVLQNFAVDKNTSETKGLYNSYIKTLIDLFLIENDTYAENKSSVLEMAPAFEATGNEFAKGEVDLVTQVDEYFKTFNNQAYNEEIGNVLIDKRGIKDDIAHGIGRKKAATFVAVPDVIKNGKVVDYQKNWKGRGYDTAVIAAPVTIAGEKHYMGVVVIQNKENNRFYVHEVATIKKEGAQPFKTSLAENNSNAGGDTPSVISILQNLAENNPSSVKIIANSQKNAGKPLDTTELQALNTILHHMNFVFESYGKIWRGGRWVEATDIASEQIAIYKEAQGNKTVVGRLIENGYFNFFMDPELVCTRLDGHDKNGYFTTLLEDLRQADIKQRYDEMLALKRYDEFEKKHKKYIKDLMSEKNTVRVGNAIDHHAKGGPTANIVEIPRYAALDLYMVSKTRGALETFEKTGWRLRLDSSKGKLETPQATITEAQIKGIEKQLTKEDLELIEIMEEQYNVNLRRLKYDTDMIRLGMSNVFDGYYYPINRISANNLDSNDFFFDLERVSNSSFNNSRVKGAKQAIIVSNVLTKFKKHVNGVTRYANLSIPIENMTKLLNIDVGDNANMPQSITMLLRETKDGQEAEKYIKTLIKDVQQVNIQTDASTKAVSYLRGAYAKSTLGFNPKVLFTQASSFIAGFGELRGTSLAWALKSIGKLKGLDSELDKYCPWAAVRHYEKGATRAMTVTDKISKVGDFFTKGIEFMDRQIVKLEYLACQYEAKVRFHLEIGTEENKIKAGELLQELGLKTQQNQLTTEKSSAMRSTSEFAKTLTMFKADSMKQISRFLQNVSAMSVLKKKMAEAKRVGDTARYNALEAEYKRAQKSFCKYSAVIVVSSIYMVLLARLFNKLYGKEEEDENKVLGFFEDLFGNVCGMIPIISELYAFFIDGYEVNSFMYSTINNTMDAVKSSAEVVGGLVNGDNISQEKINGSIRNLFYSVGALAGLPAKNIYKNAKALVDIVSPSTGDKVDAWFKAPSSADLEGNIKEGIEKGDNKAVSTSLSLLYDKYDLELKDAVLRGEYDRLMRLEMTKSDEDEENGIRYTPLEAKIPNSIKIDDEEVELTRKDVNAFKNAFGEAEKSQARIVKTVPYKKLNDEQRAYALRKISQYYFEDTKYTYTGDKSNFAYYAKVIGVEDLALILAYAKGLKGDEKTESRGRLKVQVNVRGAQSRRQKIEAYIKSLRLNSVQTSLALRCLGYSDEENDKQVISYVKRCYLLTEDERTEFVKILE